LNFSLFASFSGGTGTSGKDIFFLLFFFFFFGQSPPPLPLLLGAHLRFSKCVKTLSSRRGENRSGIAMVFESDWSFLFARDWFSPPLLISSPSRSRFSVLGMTGCSTSCGLGWFSGREFAGALWLRVKRVPFPLMSPHLPPCIPPPLSLFVSLPSGWRGCFPFSANGRFFRMALLNLDEEGYSPLRILCPAPGDRGFFLPYRFNLNDIWAAVSPALVASYAFATLRGWLICKSSPRRIFFLPPEEQEEHTPSRPLPLGLSPLPLS